MLNLSEMDIKETIKAERRAYARKWRKDNPDKVRQHNENYWRRRVERKLTEDRSGKEG